MVSSRDSNLTPELGERFRTCPEYRTFVRDEEITGPNRADRSASIFPQAEQVSQATVRSGGSFLKPQPWT
jgi:hypothetical protein